MPELKAPADSELHLLRQLARKGAGWLRVEPLGLVVAALAVGGGAGIAAAGFRWLIFAFTWLATGHQQFGQQGRTESLHLPWLGVWFLLIIPVAGGLIYGPLIQRFAKEARGHGVPEVMLAVSENGGRIRPPVTLVKALASALCIGVGGSVGREGPIVQIGSAFASSIGQFVRMSETRLRILVACGAAGGISATFNAPITGLFFGFEIILREFSLDALFATILSSVAADLVSHQFFGSAPFFSQIPHDLSIRHPSVYLLVALLGLAGGVIGWAFKSILYKLQDIGDALWGKRPEWARPAVGGLGLGLLLLALPQMYGVGYPVMDKVISGHTVLWLLVVLMLGKIFATSLTLAIGGSGGVFAPSLFIGAMGGIAFGTVVQHLFGNIVGSPAIFAVIAMGAVFGAAAQAPLTAISSVAEMTGNFTLILPVMLATGIATALSKHLSYGSIYTTKLLRRGIDIERPKPTTVLQRTTVADAMFPLTHDEIAWTSKESRFSASGISFVEQLAGPGSRLVEERHPQVLFCDETLEQALRQLALFGRFGLPVMSSDGQELLGWITRRAVLRVLAERLDASAIEAEEGTIASEWAEEGARRRVHLPRTPLDGFGAVEILIGPDSALCGRRLCDIELPENSRIVAVTEGLELVAPRSDQVFAPGERLVLLVSDTALSRSS